MRTHQKARAMLAAALGQSEKPDPDRIADFVMFAQQSCILNLSAQLNEVNVSFPQFFLLAYLSSEDHLSMTDIAKKMGHSTGAATGLVDRLERMGFVQRFHAAEDRRKINVRIAQKGTELVARMRKQIASNLVSILSDMDKEVDPHTLPLDELEELVKRLREENASLRPEAVPKRTPRRVLPIQPVAAERVSTSGNVYPNLGALQTC